MKNLLLYLAAIFLFPSCAMEVIPLGKTVTQADVPKPYVRTYTTTVQAEKVSEHMSRIEADNQKFLKSDVISYSTGKSEYFKIYNKSFALKSGSGDINIFTSESQPSSYAAPGSTNFSAIPNPAPSTSYYINTNEFTEVKLLNYKSLNPLIKPSEAAYKYLDRYKHNNKVTNTILTAGIVTLTGCIALWFVDHGGSHQAVNVISGTGILASEASFFFVMGRKWSNRRNLYKTVGMHNGVWHD